MPESLILSLITDTEVTVPIAVSRATTAADEDIGTGNE